MHKHPCSHDERATVVFPKLLWALIACLAPGCVSLPDDALGVTPQRPTLSSDTGTAARGTFELEAGIALDPDDSFSSPLSLKYGVSDAAEIFLDLSPYEHLEEGGDGIGDTSVGMRHRFWESESSGTSAALQFATKLPTGDAPFSSGEMDFAAAAILTHEFDPRTVATAYYEAGWIGDPDASGVDAQHTVAIAASRSFSGHIGVFAEVAHVDNAESPDPLLAMVGVTKSINESLAFDVGVAFGLNDAAPDATALIGFSVNFGQLFRR